VVAPKLDFLRDVFNWFDVAAIIPFYTDVVFDREKNFVNFRKRIRALGFVTSIMTIQTTSAVVHATSSTYL
jgi:hypothetical protein